ncbi:MAG: asparagine synthase (glutamine-hydrolyzing), partial [Calditrichaeota bacterium]
MCGIAGIYHQNLSPINPMILKRMTDILQHRGPDDSGYFLFNLKTNDAQTSLAEPTHANEFHIGLGHRRLSILDLSSHGHQPMHNEDKTIWITYNGEIYNYIELRAELVRAGHQFYSRTDSEVIIHAYEQWGIDCLNKFNGMWAFAILDTRQKKLFCARDRFGIKPFYFYYDKGAFYFASEIKALLQIRNLPIEYNHAKILRYLIWGLIDEDEQTMIQSIKRLKPGHYLILDKQKLSEACYYDLKSKLTLREIQTEKIEQTFRELFFDSVNLRLRSDVPIGTCLSGGLDSSSILSVMRQLSPNATTLHTFSSIFKGEAIDESR